MKSDYTSRLLALTLVNGLGPKTILKLINNFGSLNALWQASFFDLKNNSLSDKLAKKIIKVRQSVVADGILKIAGREQIKITNYFDNDYPPLLKQTPSPPIILYYRGKINDQFVKPSLAVVGSRKISQYGKTVLPEIINQLRPYQIHIVSGLAYGTDSLAHQLALTAGLPTSAVLGCGLAWSTIRSSRQLKLMQRIINQNGVVFSEFEPNKEARPEHFPRRNRIIAGLAQAVLVVEGTIKSGSLITAKLALDAGREVLAFPGNINRENSDGPNFLIKNGARPVTEARDICESLNLVYLKNSKIKKIEPRNKAEAKILTLLSKTPIQINQLIAESGQSTATVNAVLSTFEIEDKVINLGNNLFILK